jgi:hypothetical protein
VVSLSLVCGRDPVVVLELWSYVDVIGLGKSKVVVLMDGAIHL